VAIINGLFRSIEHKFMVDVRTLQIMPDRLGFTHITRCAVGEGQDVTRRGLDSHGRVISDKFNRLESCVLEGNKPG
jgi:hypothetical protein